MIEEAPAHEEEEKKTTLRGGNPQVTDWTYTEDGTTITLTRYTGSSTDVVIPTAQDLGFDESYTAQISKGVLQSVANNKTSLSTSTNGKKIVVSSTDLSYCFEDKSTLTTMNLSNLDTSNVTNMSSVFNNCRGLTSLDVSNWDTSNVTNMVRMFNNCSGLTTLDLSSWNCDKVTSNTNMFKTSASTPLLVKTTDTKLKNYDYASDNRTKLGKVKIAAENGKFEGDVQELSLFDYTTDKDLTEAGVTSQLTTRKKALIPNEGYMFKEWTPEATYTTFAEKAGGTYTAEVKQADWEWTYNSTDNVVTLTKYIGESKDVVIPTAKDCGHEGATAKISKEVLQQAVNAVSATSLTTSDNGDKIVVSSTDLSNCFASKRSLTTMDLSNLDVSNVTKMYGMFYDCSGLTSLDVSHFDTSKVTTMSSMFADCQKLTSLDVSHFDTSKVTTMSSMFADCQKLTSLDVSNWDTSNVTTMYNMFYNCYKLTSLDVSNWDTSNVTTMYNMFYNCDNLTTLDLSSWNCDKVTNNGSMFRTSASTPLLVKTTDTMLKNYNYASDNRTKLGKVKIAAENGNFEGDVQELVLFDYTTDKDLTEAGVTSQLETMKAKLNLKDNYMFVKWMPEGDYESLFEKANGTYEAEVCTLDYLLTIPKYYMLTDRHTYAQGQVGLFDKEQTNQPYTGNLLVDVTMS
ncbi:BspA family leucine-rich repeat surface protein, partial [Enterococcus faecium]